MEEDDRPSVDHENSGRLSIYVVVCISAYQESWWYIKTVCHRES